MFGFVLFYFLRFPKEGGICCQSDFFKVRRTTHTCQIKLGLGIKSSKQYDIFFKDWLLFEKGN